MIERRALGKGISALIPERETGKQERVLYLSLHQIKPNPFQPREDFAEQSLQELTQSIREKGVIQPVLVRRKGESYELIAGERRWRAAKLLNLKEIPAIVKDTQDEDALILSLIENLQRDDLNPIEEARAFQYLIDKFEVTQDKISEVLGKARVTIANTLRLLKLPKEIQDEIRKGRLSFAHGRALLELEDPNQQRRLAQEAIAKRLSVRELENLVKGARPRSSRRRLKPSAVADTFVGVVQEELQQLLGTKVRIFLSKKRGHLRIEFYSQDDLRRIVNVIRGKAAL